MANRRVRSSATFACTGALLAVWAAPSQALDADYADQQEPIVVIGQRPSYTEGESATATRTGTPLRDTPQSITIITEDLIQDQGMRSMADVVRYVPGVAMGQGEGHRDAPTLRGNATTADFFIDGVRDDVQYYRDLYNAERIEVLKGPNAMIFGRGGGGGVINRVTAWADWTPERDLTLSAGSHGEARAALDFGAALNPSAALRLAGVYEDSHSYRDSVELLRRGVNPTAAMRLGDNTLLRLGFERFDDERTVDRGVPSENGRPWNGDASAFFGNPDESFATAEVNLFSARIEHDFGGLVLRNTTLAGGYEKFYQNIYPGSAVDGGGNVALAGYNSGTDRDNVFNQTDLIFRINAGPTRHTILAGFEFGRQQSDNTRSQNFTGLGSVNVAAPTSFVAPTIPAALQTDSRVEAGVAAVYLQDQIALGPHWQAIAGVRFDSFELDYDNRLGADFSREDELVSPRAGLIYRPVEPLSLYASYSVSYLPQSGDQFSSLDAATSTLEPEEFENLELGLKWDLRENLALTAAVYRLDRTNTRAIDPGTLLTVQTGAQRSEGLELGLAGSIGDRWDVVGGYAYQNVEISRSTAAAPAGRVVPLTPEHTFSLWNMVQATPRLGLGLGIVHQSESFASISNAVTLPAFTRIDAAVSYALTDAVEAQLNIENLLDEEYWATAHSDNNIMPASPMAVRFALRMSF